ncbi:MAG: MarR family winged helix-turn-helix transcriptional regulator [Rhodospirillaceae bacterium]
MAIRRQDALGYQIGLLSRLFDKALEEHLTSFQVSPGQFPALVMLYEQDGLTQAELCKRIQVEQPTMANTLNRMERDDLIRRVPDPQDKRRVHVYLTDQAKTFKQDLIDAARAVPSQALVNFSTVDQDAFFRYLAKIIENLQDKEA